MDEFVGRVAADKRIDHFFAATAGDAKRLAAFKTKLVDQICEASGGPCKYMGKDMKSAHMGMGVAGADFDALVEDLVGALDALKVPAKEKNELLGALGPMKKDIVEKCRPRPSGRTCRDYLGDRTSGCPDTPDLPASALELRRNSWLWSASREARLGRA